jgi:septal ring factor EnvC (AmiA/AmiB activator)
MKKSLFLFASAVMAGSLGTAEGALPPAPGVAAPRTVSSSPSAQAKRRLSDQLDTIRGEVIDLQKDLLVGFRTRQQARSQIEKIKTLMGLQKRERQLGLERMKELEKTVVELEARRSLLLEKTNQRKSMVRNRVKSLLSEPEFIRSPLVLDEAGERDVVGRHLLSSLARTSIREIEELKVDLADAENLEKRIQDEKQQLAYLFQDLEEQKSLLELNQQIQVDLLRKEHQARVAQLENYRKLKGSEAQLETMIRDFNSRRELEDMVERDRATARAARAIEDGIFARLKGRLGLPIDGRILSKFGRFLDPQSQLHVFKKGIDIEARPQSPVRSVAAGKIAFSGELPNYGKVLIIDHGDHYYTLCGNLGSVSRKTGDGVGSGDILGSSSVEGAPVYFEIRSRNIAVNPLQWMSSSISLNP